MARLEGHIQGRHRTPERALASESSAHAYLPHCALEQACPGPDGSLHFCKSPVETESPVPPFLRERWLSCRMLVPDDVCLWQALFQRAPGPPAPLCCGLVPKASVHPHFLVSSSYSCLHLQDKWCPRAGVGAGENQSQEASAVL